MTAHNGFRLTINGLVQGVGFRPTIWRIANDLGLHGSVFNDAAGVVVELLAGEAQCDRFINVLYAECPLLARIDSLKVAGAVVTDPGSFVISETQQGSVSTGCAPDAATCPQCRAELFDRSNRRFRYPFINCTHCGPRLSIIRQIPYDRATTTMAQFTQCPKCQTEYEDPADRRFHAQPNACDTCGPQVWLEDNQGQKQPVDEVFSVLATALRTGNIVAIKGLGGFHLACDATNPEAVAELRLRKHRPDKAFALMVPDLDVLRSYAALATGAANLLSSPEAPVVLLDAVKNSKHPLAENVAPGQYQLGFMLPYTPLHLLLMETLDAPLVMTSGNRSGAPQAITNEDAREQLSEIADLFLMHDRPIQNRVDDSVVRQIVGRSHYLRRARGYAPTSLALPPGFEQSPDLVALGAELKNTLCLIQAGRAILTQHLGDLEDARTYEQYQHTLSLYQSLYQHQSDLYVCDQHPEYLSTKFGEQLAEEGKALIRVQHHHAHLAACLGENGYPLDGEPVLGICLDGTGFGLDNTLWGGEFLLGGYQQIERLAHIKPFPLVGGVQAIREPWRCLYAQLKQANVAEPSALEAAFPLLATKPCATLDKMIEKGLNCPLTSSAGRLFDAVAAALGCHGEGITYEGQAAIELETLAREGNPETPAYQFANADNRIDPAPFWQQLIAGLKQRNRADMAMAFHKGFANAVVEQTLLLHKAYGFKTVALSGGVMQNGLLFSTLENQLGAQGFTVLTHQMLPANDGCIAFGQALIAAAQTQYRS
ncbi:carbamoyltransferase HypF [Pontibacterium granulatum]|uniref:carbamoyltransferase HypF n=1 Tax=Pontibacterium granulatum TaxID=2036029 RepID=UPI00249B7B1A|nr:carbamoyltransferase HypF [Pontibacterium granulatum]MDI3323277.1 carbamoyltransferase HypF [Pontibacterium granulatum]